MKMAEKCKKCGSDFKSEYWDEKERKMKFQCGMCGEEWNPQPKQDGE